jgi:hypothetical protein
VELNAEQFAILDMIGDRTDIKGYASIHAFSDTGRAICAHLMQRGFIGFNFESDGYYINSTGRREIDKARNPPDPRAQLLDDIAALERQLDAKRAALAALGSDAVDSETAVKRGIAARFHEGD